MGKPSFNATVAAALLSSSFTILVAPPCRAQDAGAVEAAPAVAPSAALSTPAPAVPTAPSATPNAEPGATQASAGISIPPPAPAAQPAGFSGGGDPWGPVQVVVYKGARRLALYRGGNFDREYAIVLGLQPEGRKRHAHDARTPEGLYHVVGKARHPRWQHFLAIDYPNERDKAAYAADVQGGRVPLEDSAPFGIGSELGIHGNDRPEEQAKGVDWTKGCVAMREADIAEVAAAVKAGTPVWIVP